MIFHDVENKEEKKRRMLRLDTKFSTSQVIKNDSHGHRVNSKVTHETSTLFPCTIVIIIFENKTLLFNYHGKP